MLVNREVLLQTPDDELTGGHYPRSTIRPAFNGDGGDQLNEISFCGQVYKSKDAPNDIVTWIFSYATTDTSGTEARFAVGIKGANIVCILGASNHEVELQVTCCNSFI